jgi:uncharacterized protein (TIGR00725 family)
MKRKLIISVIGGSLPTSESYRLAELVGKELGRRGLMVCCGGLGGVMEAVCKGAKSEGGVTVGILPGDDPKAANRYVDVPICTGIGHARNVIVVKTGRAVIAIDGSYGTMSEIGHALAEGIPVVGIKTWTFLREGELDSGVVLAENPADAVEQAVKLAEL